MGVSSFGLGATAWAKVAHSVSCMIHDQCSDVPHDIGLKVVECLRQELNATPEEMFSGS